MSAIGVFKVYCALKLESYDLGLEGVAEDVSANRSDPMLDDHNSA